MRDYRVMTAVGLICVATVLAAACANEGTPREITVERINVVDESGEVRLVIAGELPDPVVRGQQLEGGRSCQARPRRMGGLCPTGPY